MGFFGAQRIMAPAYLGPHLVQQLGLRGWDCRLGGGEAVLGLDLRQAAQAAA